MDAKLDSEHLFVITNRKHFALYDLLQEKKLGSCFNNFIVNEEDKLPQEKEFTTLSIVSESTIIAIGSASGNIYMLRS